MGGQNLALDRDGLLDRECLWVEMACGAGIDSLSLDHRNGTKLRFLPPNVHLADRIQVCPVLTNETTLL